MKKATAQAKNKQQNTLYKKSSSGKYTPYTDPWAYEGLSEGWWLVKVNPGSTTIRQCVNPDKAELEAAKKDAEERIMSILSECLKSKPKASQISPEFARAWERLSKKYRHEMLLLEYPSLYEAAEKILNELLQVKSSKSKLEKSNPPSYKIEKPHFNIWQ